MTGEDKEFIRVKELKSNDIENDDTGIGFFGSTPVAQATTGVAEAAFTANSGTAINDNSTFGGYTIQQIVKALQLMGVLA